MNQMPTVARRLCQILAPLLLLAAGACTTNPATGRAEFTPFLTPAQEIALGAQEHPKLTAEFGGIYDDPELGGYLAEVGGRLAAASELPNLDFTFTLLNSPVVNAFALPGGYVYMSRGLLALFNDEAEMASVLGHEIGHVTARHSANRYNRSIFVGLGAAVTSAAVGSNIVTDLLNQGSQLYLLSYSRGQELQADSLGIRYVDRVRYDPLGSPRMLGSLGAYSDLQARISGQQAQQTPSIFRTHPLSSERVEKALQTVRALPQDRQSGAKNRDRFLDAIDGMIFGDDPAQGIAEDGVFRHPTLKLAFAVPPGYMLRNTEEAVYISGPGDFTGLFTGGSVAANKTNDQLLQEAWASIAGTDAAALGNLQRFQVNGIEAVTGTAVIGDARQSSDVRMVVYRYDAAHGYSFLFLTPRGGLAQASNAVESMIGSFRKISDAEAAEVRALRIKVVTVEPGDTPTSLAEGMAFESHRLDRFLVLNGLSRDAVLKAGARVKLVVRD